MRRGVWVPEGCAVVDGVTPDSSSESYRWNGWGKAEWVSGTPRNNNEIASYKLASFVSLSVNWNDIAEAWLSAQSKPQRLRNIVNQWFAETWQIRRSRSEPEDIAKRITTDYQRGVVPEWAEFLSLGVDRQRSDGSFVVYVLVANGPEGMAHVVDYGTSNTLDEMWDSIGRRPHYRPDASEPLYVGPCAVDSGWDAPGTYAFCRHEKHENCVPCKVGNTSDESVGFKWTDLKDSGHETDGLSLLLVSTNYTETDLQHRLDSCVPCSANGLGIFSEASKDVDFIAQITNAALSDKLDSRGEPVLMWVKKDDATPNDYRDALRYSLAVAEAWRTIDGEAGTIRQDVKSEQRPDGRNWID